MYFDTEGKINTEQTLKLAFERGKELGLTEVVIASTTGQTVCKAMEIFTGFKIVMVTYHCGFKEPFKKVLADDVRKDLESKDITVVSATHALSGVERALGKKYSGIYPVLLIAQKIQRHLSGAADCRCSAAVRAGNKSCGGSFDYGCGCRRVERK